MKYLSEITPEIDQIQTSIVDLSDAMQLGALKNELENIMKKQNDINFWNNIELSNKLLKRSKIISNKIKSVEEIENKYRDLKTLLELAIEQDDNTIIDEIVEETNQIKNMINQKKSEALLTGEYDTNSAIMTLHAGAGGTEAQDWVEMLYRMYSRFCQIKAFKIKLLDYLNGEEAGLKSITILIEGINAYGYLKGEAGVHRLVRISPFDASGRRHTSFASVEVTPEINDEIKIDIAPEDIKMDVFRASGAGGQHVNKTSSAVRLTHLPTGIVVTCQNERSQYQNREMALKMLKSKLLEIKHKEHLDKIEDIKGIQKEIAWGSQIRSYIFMPYKLAKDHRTGFETGNVTSVLDGNLDGFIDAYLKFQASSNND